MRVMNEPIVYELALKSVANGEIDAKPVPWSGRGRPSEAWLVHGVTLNKWQYDEYRRFFEFGMKCRGLKDTSIMTSEEIQAHIQDAAPKIMKRMVDMALVTDDLKAIKAVHSDLMDRGYGRAAERIDLTVSTRDIRAAWKQLEQRQVKKIEAQVIEEDNEIINQDGEVIEAD